MDRPEKCYYKRSELPSVRALLGEPAWDLQTIEKRAKDLTDRFLEIWKHPGPDTDTDADVERLVPILDAPRKPGYYKGWKTEFEYVKFQDQTWYVQNAKDLLLRVHRELWDTRRDDVLVHSHVISKKTSPETFDIPLGDSYYLYAGLFPQWALEETQRVLDELDLADQVIVKYSTEED